LFAKEKKQPVTNVSGRSFPSASLLRIGFAQEPFRSSVLKTSGPNFGWLGVTALGCGASSGALDAE
jgi:hypothetical protein